MNLKSILMPTDFSDCADAALGEALLFARQFGAELHVLHVIEWPPSGSTSVVDLVAMEDVFEHLADISKAESRRLLARLPSNEVKIREVQRQGVSAAPEIVDYATQEQIDLIVLGTHGRRGFRRFLLGSVAEEVVRTAGCPVLSVPEGGDLDTDLEIARIVVPYDFSDDARASLRTAVLLARSFGSRIDLVHAYLPATLTGPPVPTSASVPATLTDSLVQSLSDAAAQATTDEVSVEPHLLVGSASSSITHFAEKAGANLIVMASHGLTGLHRFLMGSVTERVVRSATCPVLVCRNRLTSDEASNQE